MAKQGHTIVFITHKLRSHRGQRLGYRLARRQARGSFRTGETSERKLAQLMVGHDIQSQINRKQNLSTNGVLEVIDLHAQ
jgi:ABC-type uncharacterized transport system ATPase subunit